MAASNKSKKVRIYDLAKELKLDNKRIIEDARREGHDVSVPSNTIPEDIANKIRNKYFPKQEAIAPRAVRVVKKAVRPAPEETRTEAAASPVPEQVEIAPAPAPSPPTGETQKQAQPAAVRRVLRRIAPPPIEQGAPPSVESAQPAEAAAEPTQEPPAQVEAEKSVQPTAPAQKQTPPEAQAPVEAPKPKAGQPQVKVIRLTPPVGGIPRPTEPAKPTRPERESAARAERARTQELHEQPEETRVPQTTYIPPPDARRRGARTRHARKEKIVERDVLPPPRPRSLEERLMSAVNVASGELKPIRLVEGATVKDFAEKIGLKPKDVVALLLQRGVLATINQTISNEAAIELGRRFGYEVKFVPFEEMVAEEEFEDLIETGADDVEVPRAPVITVMGHVDHGKTSLLDAIRATDVAAHEAGGITQHIGAYSVHVPNPDNPSEMRRVVFLDTPGHEAFTMMRARGAKVTDIVVLVVAADDGVMPQTIEAIEHARAAGVPIIVAINKIDKPEANPERVKTELAQQGLTPVEWGGDTEMVLVSAKKRQNLDVLLETILLTADLLNLRASPTRLASGVVLEAKLDRGRGPVATVLVQQGTLRIGDPFIVGQVYGKVRALYSDRGEPVQEAGPATPVEVLGLQGVPQAGDQFQVVTDIARAQQIAQHRQMLARQSALVQTVKRGIEALGEKEVKELLVVLKADVQGSVEVLKSTLQKLSTDKIKVKVIRSGVGAITESDVLLASATQAGAKNTAVVIIGFNVRPEARAAELAKQEGVDIRLHSIIYKVEEEIRAAMLGMLEAVERERVLGRAEIREVFRVPRVGNVAGCMVTEGVVRRSARARLVRDGIVIWEGNIASLRRFKEDVAEVREGFECGVGLENFNDIKVGDQIEVFTIEKVAATEL
ncbi:translation initiation factor IF-2 [Pyrinomonas methylaliphatogenes]|uniref:Translation initiation factor IF-2 n=1 Tax=Pyrinomonas methylaliphatogenes TaxID=454194 RepID=A0A0B6WYY0_9BACT|nr:translation initiation factor IF-2 [Pyrinomonas methylaliphatogenes]MBX5478148.1 translation initiation factor IF-2 [Pyrinomonas methylaliphatogenes]CDM66463.1 bacterial translation initiation factor 2 (bIF-2) [Pyrinomonas methylaliphatogenes]